MKYENVNPNYAPLNTCDTIDSISPSGQLLNLQWLRSIFAPNANFNVALDTTKIEDIELPGQGWFSRVRLDWTITGITPATVGTATAFSLFQRADVTQISTGGITWTGDSIFGQMTWYPMSNLSATVDQVPACNVP